MSEPRGLTGEGLDQIINAETGRPYEVLVRPVSGETIDSLQFAFGGLSANHLFRTVQVSCSITVNGETVTAHQRVDAFAWDNGGAALQESVKAHVRQQCALEVIKKFPPEVTIRT